MVFYSCPRHYDHLVRARGLYCPVGGCKGFGAGKGGGSAKGGSGEDEVFPNKGVHGVLGVGK